MTLDERRSDRSNPMPGAEARRQLLASMPVFSEPAARTAQPAGRP